MSRHRRPRPRRRVVARLLAAGAVVVGLAAWPAPAGAAPQEAHAAGSIVNRAVAQNDRDDSYLHRLAFSVRQTSGDTVTVDNLAFAAASCRACRTVAVAVQVVVVARHGRHDGPSGTLELTAVNRAVAANERCVDCDTLALAYQFVVVDEDLRLSAEARQRLHAVRRELADLLRAGAPDEVITGRMAALAGDVQQALTESAQGRPERLRAKSDRRRALDPYEDHGRPDLGGGQPDDLGDGGSASQ